MRMKIDIVRLLVVAASLWAVAGTAQADRRDVRDQGNRLPPEQHQQMREQMREQWRQNPPVYRERREERRERWQQIPSEDRSRLREELREQRGGARGRQ